MEGKNGICAREYTFATIVTGAFFMGTALIAWGMSQTPSLVLFVPLMVLFWLISLGWAHNGDLNKGEMRRAIAGSIFSGFIILVFLSVSNAKFLEINKDMVNFFFGVVSTVIGFYFGYRSGEEKSAGTNADSSNK